MSKPIVLDHTYPVTPDRLFAMICDLDALDAVSRPMVLFDHLPSGLVRTGQVVDVAVSVFGVLPSRPYRFRVIKCDPKARILRFQEDGFGVNRLIHEAVVTPEGTNARLVDHIDIEAGWKTPVLRVWMWMLFRWRHYKRTRLLDRL
jgi:hypothetical protein